MSLSVFELMRTSGYLRANESRVMVCALSVVVEVLLQSDIVTLRHLEPCTCPCKSRWMYRSECVDRPGLDRPRCS